MRQRNGFTLVELLVAAVMLVIIVTGTARFAASFTKTMGSSTIRVVATGVATDRLELIRSDPRYDQLVTLYGSGSGADTTGFSGYPNMRRITTVTRDQTGPTGNKRDRTVITIQVLDPRLTSTLAITTVVASP